MSKIEKLAETAQYHWDNGNYAEALAIEERLNELEKIDIKTSSKLVKELAYEWPGVDVGDAAERMIERLERQLANVRLLPMWSYSLEGVLKESIIALVSDHIRENLPPVVSDKSSTVFVPGDFRD